MMEVHYYWVQSLINGKMFVSGMFPFGIHCVFVVISLLTGINATECGSYFFGDFSSANGSFGALVFLRKFFKFRIGIIFAIFVWSSFRVRLNIRIFSFSNILYLWNTGCLQYSQQYIYDFLHRKKK
jgi:hypothetical protein